LIKNEEHLKEIIKESTLFKLADPETMNETEAFHENILSEQNVIYESKDADLLGMKDEEEKLPSPHLGQEVDLDVTLID